MVQELMLNGPDRIANGSFNMMSSQQMPYMQPQQQFMQQPQYGMGGGQYGMAQPFAYGQAPAGGAAGGMMPGMMYPQQQQQQHDMSGYAAKPIVSNPTPAAKPAANPWSEHRTDDGVPYWYNATTRTSQV
jgi:hypothetical protein